MATAEGIAKLVTKQAGRAKEKVSTSHSRPKIALYSSAHLSSHLAFWLGHVMVAVRPHAVRRSDRPWIDMGRGQRSVVVAPFVRSFARSFVRCPRAARV